MILLAFLAGYLLRVAWERWRQWEMGRPESHREASLGGRRRHRPSEDQTRQTTRLAPDDSLARYYPPGTSWSYTEADPPDPYTERLVG